MASFPNTAYKRPFVELLHKVAELSFNLARRFLTMAAIEVAAQLTDALPLIAASYLLQGLFVLYCATAALMYFDRTTLFPDEDESWVTGLAKPILGMVALLAAVFAVDPLLSLGLDRSVKTQLGKLSPAEVVVERAKANEHKEPTEQEWSRIDSPSWTVGVSRRWGSSSLERPLAPGP